MMYEDMANLSILPKTSFNRRVLVDPDMTWQKALDICNHVVGCHLVRINGLPVKNETEKSYSSKQIASAWLIVSRGYSD